MTYDEIKNTIIKAIADKDNIEIAMKEVLDLLEEDYGKLETTNNENTELKERVKSLQDTNHRLFLAQTKYSDEPEEEEKPEGEGVFEEYLKLKEE